MNQAHDVEPDFTQFLIFASRWIESLCEHLHWKDSLNVRDRLFRLIVLAHSYQKLHAHEHRL
jgi:hypothetical protein